jgi:hypothetical protein
MSQLRKSSSAASQSPKNGAGRGAANDCEFYSWIETHQPLRL